MKGFVLEGKIPDIYCKECDEQGWSHQKNVHNT